MAYELEGLVGLRRIVERHVARYSTAKLVPLRQDFGLIPLTPGLLDEAQAGRRREPGPFGEFCKLVLPIINWAEQMSSEGAVAYLEAETFGGVGTQAAVVWEHGHLILGPLRTEFAWRPEEWELPAEVRHAGLGQEAFNRALRRLGVVAGQSVDEFDAVGLTAHRFTAEWASES